MIVNFPDISQRIWADIEKTARPGLLKLGATPSMIEFVLADARSRLRSVELGKKVSFDLPPKGAEVLLAAWEEAAEFYRAATMSLLSIILTLEIELWGARNSGQAGVPATPQAVRAWTPEVIPGGDPDDAA